MISFIKRGTDTSDANAIANDVLAGKTFYNAQRETVWFDARQWRIEL